MSEMGALDPPETTRLPLLAQSPWTVGAAACAGLLAIGMALALYRFPPTSLALVLVGGLLVTAALALAVARYDMAVAIGFVIMGVVKVEPAPPDLILICVIAVAFVTGRFVIDRVPMAVLGTVGAFVALNLLSAIEAISPERAAFFLSITLYVAVFSLWLAGYVNSARRAHLILSAYLVAAVASAILGVAAILGPIPGHDTFVFAGDRARALFKDPNVFGPFLVPAILMLLEEIINPRLLKMRRLVQYLLLLVLVLGVIFSFSRAAWLNLGIGLVILFAVLLLTGGGSRRAARLIALLVTAGAIAVLALSATGSTEFLNERASVQSYDTQRFGAQKFGIKYAEDHPLGAGPGQFDKLSSVSAHSTYVRVLTEQGLLGIASFIAIVLVTLVLAGSNAALGRSTYGIGSAALLAAWCGVLANSVFVDTLHWRHLWMVAGLIWAGAMRSNSAGAIRPYAEPQTAPEPQMNPEPARPRANPLPTAAAAPRR